MSYFSVPDIIEIAELSQPFAVTDTLKGQLFSPRINPKLYTVISLELAAVKWAYSQTPSYTDIQFTANYLYDLCGIYALRARNALDPGGIPITPVGPTDDCTGMVLITETDFEADGVTVINTDWVNKTIFIFWVNIPNYIFAPASWAYLPGGGFTIVIPGFDAHGVNNDVQMVVSVGCFNPGGSIFPSQFPINEIVTVTGVDSYELTWGAVYIAKYGIGNFFVSQDDGGGNYNPTGIQPVPDNPDSPTKYTFSGLGNLNTRITIS